MHARVRQRRKAPALAAPLRWRACTCVSPGSAASASELTAALSVIHVQRSASAVAGVDALRGAFEAGVEDGGEAAVAGMECARGRGALRSGVSYPG